MPMFPSMFTSMHSRGATAHDDSSASLDPVSSLKTTTRQGLEAVFEMVTFLASKPASWRPFLTELGGAAMLSRPMTADLGIDSGLGVDWPVGAGLAAAGVDVWDAGIVPTPAVASVSYTHLTLPTKA